MSALAAIRPMLAAAVVLAWCGVEPMPLAAQRATPLEPMRTTVSLRNARADTLEERATTLLRYASRWAEAARLQRTAAELRGDDPRAAEAFTRAAWMYSGAGRLGRAREMMERAAEHAAAAGDIERSANAWLDAALIAVEAKREDVVPGLLGKARLAVSSPLLPAERRALILQRIDGAPALAAHWYRGRPR